MGKIANLLSIKVSRSFAILKALMLVPRWTDCSICKRTTFFYEEGHWPREKDRCVRCGSIPRWRALFQTLEDRIPEWRTLAIHESSPYGAVSQKLKMGCTGYTPTYYFPGVKSGSYKNGFRCENLEQLSFVDHSFDIVITQDVLEHVANPQAVCREICRTLKKGGRHIFTLPCDWSKNTEPRVTFNGSEIIHLKNPEYHGNPIDNKGSLVVTDWGNDVCVLINQWTGMNTEVIKYYAGDAGASDEGIDVFMSCKD